MSSYRRRDHAFAERLARRADELAQQTLVTRCNVTQRIVILELPGLTFSSIEDAVTFLRRVALQQTWRSQ
jgi:hypothetical protein